MSTKKHRASPAQKSPTEPTATDPSAGGPVSSEITNPPESSTLRAKQAEREAAEMFSMFRRELGSSGFVTLQRSHPATGQFKPGNIGTMPADQFTVENVMAVYGGGDFIARGRTAGGNFNEERRFTIDHTIPPKNPLAATTEKKEPASPSLDLPALLREMREATPKQDNSLLLAMLSQQTAIIQAAMQRPEPKQDPMLGTALGQIVGLVEKLSNRLDRMESKLIEAQKPAASLRDQMLEAKEIFEVFDRPGSSEKPESFWKELGKGAAEALVPLVKAHFAGAAPLNQTAPLLTAAASSVTAAPASPHLDAAQPAAITAQPPAPEEMNATLNFALKMFRSQAIAAAKNNLEPFAWTESILASVPAPMLNAVYKAANDENWFANIFGPEPEATKFTLFLNQVRESVLAKAFRAHVEAFWSVKNPAPETAQVFLNWVTSDFDDTLAELVEPDDWKEFFKGSTVEPVWLEQLRADISKFINQAEEAPASNGATVSASGKSKPADVAKK